MDRVSVRDVCGGDFAAAGSVVLAAEPEGESYWAEAQVVFCTGESFVPVKRARLAVTVHDAAYFEAGAHLRDKSYWVQRAKWTLLFRELGRKADMIHTVSHFSADRLGHFFPGMRGRIRVVHNAVSPRFFGEVAEAGAAFLEAQGLAGRRFVLIPGGLHFRKNAELILEALPALRRRFPEVVFAVVNHSNGEYAERATGLGMRMLGFVSDEALHALYAGAAAVWFPSRYEGFGMPVIEAMACGARWWRAMRRRCRRLREPRRCWWTRGARRRHVAALSELLTDERASAELSRVGRERARTFTWDAAAEQMKRYFDRLV